MAKSVILMIVGDYVEDYEVMVPFQALQMVGHIVHVVSPGREVGETVTTAIHDFGDEETHAEKRGHDFTLNETFDDIDVNDYDALILPGGRAPEYLRLNEEVLDTVQYFNDENKPIAAICHGVQILISADVIGGKSCTGYPSLRADVINAGGEWEDIDMEDALIDGNLVTAQTWVAQTEWLAKFLELLGTKIDS